MKPPLEIPSDRSFDCVGLGLNAFDRIITVSRYPPADGKVAFDHLQESAGGQVASACAALSIWGMRTRYIGRIGDDRAGRIVTESLRGCKVNLDGLQAVRGATTQQAFIVADSSDHSRTIFWQRDEQLAIPPEQLDATMITSGRLLLLDGHDEPAAVHAARHARQAGVPVILDIDQMRARSHELVTQVDCVFSTRRFALELTGAANVEEALQALRRLGPVLAGVTLGDQGCLACTAQGFERVPAFKVNTVDSTGAGDVFHAGLIYGLLQDWSLRHILRFANAAGALATTVLGVQSQLPTLAKINELLATAP